jgi:hypothetical protein
LRHPGIFVALKAGTLERSSDTQSCAHTIAQEIGHFLTLSHRSSYSCASRSDGDKYDTWSMRLLMQKQNITARSSAPQGDENWPDYNEFGYGSTDKVPHGGCMLSLKNLQKSTTTDADGQCSMARNHISKGFSTLY